MPSRTYVGPGAVTLVGAGLGDPDLLTIAAGRALGQADVVVHDALIDPRVLGLCGPDTRRVSVGKRKGCGPEQGDINQLLIDEARAGCGVVRLKGGDPFVYGRGGEEVLALRAAGITVHVVPGLSSALNGPTIAGIPVTHRGTADAVTVVTGHHADSSTDLDGATGSDDDERWTHVAGLGGTVVVLMGASTARAVAWRLLRGGRPATEPAAVVHAAGRPEQQLAHLTLGDLAAVGSPLPSPAVLVIGPVAAEGFLTLDGVATIAA